MWHYCDKINNYTKIHIFGNNKYSNLTVQIGVRLKAGVKDEGSNNI